VFSSVGRVGKTLS